MPVEAIHPAATFARLGLDSAARVLLLVEIEQLLAVELSAEVVFEHQTIDELARFLSVQKAVVAAPRGGA